MEVDLIPARWINRYETLFKGTSILLWIGIVLIVALFVFLLVLYLLFFLCRGVYDIPRRNPGAELPDGVR